MAKYAGKKLTEMHGAERAARIKQLLANPGTRKLVPTADLPSSYRQQRALNARLNSPIVAGSATTNRDLAHSREAAVTTQFGPNAVGAYQQREKDTSGWYDQYLAELEKHRANVTALQGQAQGQVANLGNVTGPAGSAPVDPGNQTVAAQAQAIRSTLLGAQKGQLLGQGQAASTYADTLAHVVGPGEKVQALTAARGATDELKGKIGAFRTQFEGDAKTAEGKNILAAQALNLNTAKATTAADQGQQRIDVSKQTAKSTAHDRAVRRQQTATTTAQRGSTPNQYGVPADQWAKWSSSHRQRVIQGFKAKGGKPPDPATQDSKDFYAKYGVKPAATGAVGTAKSSISTASTWIDTVLQSNPKMGPNALGQLLVKGNPASSKKGQESVGVPAQKALWVRVALDLRYNHGKISATTADRLHKAGYSVKTLGLSTGKVVPTRANTQAYGTSPVQPQGHA